MPKKTSSSASPKKFKTPNTNTKFGRELIRSAKQILDHVEGRKVLKEYIRPVCVDVKSIRRKIGMSQTEFAAAFSLNRRTLQEWEQGKSIPDLAVRAYLTVIDQNPAAVQEALTQSGLLN